MSFPAVLYKYREWKNPWHKNILLTNSIYAPSPNEFEDEYDCNLDYVIPTTEEIRQKMGQSEKSVAILPPVSSTMRTIWIV